MQLYFSPSDVQSECKSIEMHHQQLKQGMPGDNVGFNVKNVNKNQIKRGDVCGNLNDNPPLQVVDFQAQVIVINHNNIHNKYTPVIDCHTAHIACRFNQILKKVDRRTGQPLDSETKQDLVLKSGDSAIVQMIPIKPISLEAFSDFPPLGRFAVRDMKKTVAVGIIKSVNKKSLQSKKK